MLYITTYNLKKMLGFALLYPTYVAFINMKEEPLMKKLIFLLLAVITSMFMAGCMNMPTPTSQITGSYTSGLKYEGYDCSRLSSEVDSLARRENQLVVAQEQRIKTSQMQAFLWGYGQGDGIEASELANVRGEKERVRSAMDIKSCISSSKKDNP
ncbi:hypothetical protein MNBD_DELTA01-1816 [hydrothermal vent metagenome]|uniref:Uncharacterized protein n=1 Tax=hydrothermal vent metagenome TaxID=652676 RepID=A0A3B0R688_9ZZZZ